ncbi:MAG: peptide chain release factor N(5)-glutamine methyltransferase [Candidatus Desulfofervidus auxilii]|nr:peptide chain release factor N(5)-glutamine methyltransferase [Candidatus Desulfofervidus auxilii]
MAEVWTIKDLLQWTTEYFKKKQIDAPHLTAELLLAHVLNKDRLYLYLNYDQPLNQKELSLFKNLIKRRLKREPLAYILGEQIFFSLSFKVNSSVLIPRPETENLVEIALKIIQENYKKPIILDWGTGSGVIAICLAKKIPKATIFGIDISFSALNIARENAYRHKVKVFFLLTKNFCFKEKTFDVIVSNPPYIETDTIPTLAPEIQYEPREALDGGKDGLKYIKYLIIHSHIFLKKNGWLIMEIGYNQAEAVNKIISSKNWYSPLFFKDDAGHKRVVALRKRGDG